MPIPDRFVGAAILCCAVVMGADVPVGTILEVRLESELSSFGSPRNAQFSSVLIAPVTFGGQVLLPVGTTILGYIAGKKRVGLGLVHETASLDLAFTSLTLPDGQTAPLHARVLKICNARERIDRQGVIRGIRATASLSYRMGSRITSLTMSHPLFFLPVWIVQNSIMGFPEPEIDYKAGTEMRLALTAPVAVDPGSEGDSSLPLLPAGQLVELQELAESLPSQAYSKRARESSDFTNLVFIGSRGEIERAFEAAGWGGSRPITKGSAFRSLRAMVENRGDPEASMSILLLDDAAPDITLQKGLNCVAKRHHLRAWKRPEGWRGREVWISSASEDIGFKFSARARTFDHQIDPDIDLERTKVVNDLLFTGCVDAVAQLERPKVAHEAEEARREHSFTDGAVAAVILNACQSPRHTVEASGEPLRVRPNAGLRYLRRFVLSGRSHFLRDNLYWRLYEGMRFGARVVVRWHANHVESRDRPATGSHNTPYRLWEPFVTRLVEPHYFLKTA